MSVDTESRAVDDDGGFSPPMTAGGSRSSLGLGTAVRVARRHRTALVVALMCVVACLGYSGVFEGWGFATHVIVGVAGATVCSLVGRRWDLLLGESILLNTISFFVIGIVVTQWVPGLSSPGDFTWGLANSWADLLSSQPPVELTHRLTPIPFTTAWVAAALAQELDRRIRFFGIALLGVLVGFVATSLFSAEVRSLAQWQGGVLVLLTVVLSLMHRHDSERDVGISVSVANKSTTSALALPAAVLIVVGLLAALLGPRLPLANSNDRFDLRDFQENPWDPLDVPSPLVTIKALLKDGARETPVFIVRSEQPITRWTSAVMASYDGVVWQVADPVRDAPAQFVPVDTQLPPLDTTLPSLGRTFDVEIEILALDGPWVPHAGQAVAADFDDDDSSLRLNLTTGTLARPDGHEPGDGYKLTTRIHANAGSGGVDEAQFPVDERTTEVSLAPAPILNLAAELVEGVDFGGPQVAAIRDKLVLQGFYDAGRARPPGHSFAQIATFVGDPTRIVGYEEQYAATAAVLSRLAGVPTRVVMGYKIDEARYEAGVAEVRSGDAAAWIEVLVEDVGWVPVDVTPDRSREPTDQEPGRVRRNVAIPNEPPPPPPPFESEQTDDEEEEEEETEEEDEEIEESGRSLLAALVDRPGLVAGAVALSPLLGFGALAALAIGLKALRTRRRKNAETAELKIAGAWAELVDRFEEAGHSVAPNATPLEIAEQLHLDDRVASAQPDVRELASLVSRSAFAPRPPDDSDADRAWEHAEQAADEALEGLGTFDRLKTRADPRPLLRRSPRQSKRAERANQVEPGDGPDQRTPVTPDGRALADPDLTQNHGPLT